MHITHCRLFFVVHFPSYVSFFLFHSIIMCYFVLVTKIDMDEFFLRISRFCILTTSNGSRKDFSRTGSCQVTQKTVNIFAWKNLLHSKHVPEFGRFNKKHGWKISARNLKRVLWTFVFSHSPCQRISANVLDVHEQESPTRKINSQLRLHNHSLSFFISKSLLVYVMFCCFK